MPTTLIFGILLPDAALKWPGRNQLMLALTRHTPVLFLEQAPSGKAWTRWKPPRVEPLDHNLFVMKRAYAWRSTRFGRRAAPVTARADGLMFHEALRTAGMQDFVYWLTVNDPVLARGIPKSRLVYDCMDPNFLLVGQRRFDLHEFAIARKASLVFASAETLYSRMKVHNPNTFLLPNAAMPPPSGPVKATLPPGLRTGRPIVGYLGTVDWRFDATHVEVAAEALPEVTFAIVGRVNRDQETKVRRLRELPNVVFTGPVSLESGFLCLRSFNVGIISFIPSPMNDAINPVKMYSYLADGLPVVSTWIYECRRNPFVVAAKNPVEFAEAIRCALNENSPALQQARRDYAAVNTWNQRADEAIGVLSRHGLVR